MIDELGKNKVYINDHGFIEIEVIGEQTVDSVEAMADRAEALAQDEREHGNRALVLDNLLRMGKVPKNARKKVVERAKTGGYDKLAMLGKDPLLRFAANLMLRAIGRSGKVRYFEDYSQAVDWLKSE